MAGSLALGFVGTGTISEIVIDGLVGHGGFDGSILVSPRSRSISDRLAEVYPTVEVAQDNQAAVDAADIVVLAVLPEQVDDVLSALTFASDSHVLSLVAGVGTATIRSFMNTPDATITRTIPMPPNRHGLGPLPLFPPNAVVAELLGRIGTVIEVRDEAEFQPFVGSTALMATFFELVATTARWMEAQGVGGDAAAAHATSLFHSLAAETLADDAATLRSRAQGCLTPGGLNEQVLAGADAANIFGSIIAELDQIQARINGG